MPILSNVDPILARHLKSKSEADRAKLFGQLARKEVAGQIRQLREKRGLTQVQFAKVCRMKQSAVSRIEQAEYSGWTYKTLARVAEKLHARLRISFEPMEETLEEERSRTKHQDTKFGPVMIAR
jgi:ribosome-binding protein aMBF1 (putative translation factor)